MIYKSYSKFFFAVNLAFLALASYMYFTYGGNWYIAIIPFAIMTVGFLVFKDLIDRWGFKFQDVRLDEQVLRMIMTEYPILKSYSPEQIKIFSKRLVYFLHARESYLVLGETEKLDMYHTILIAAPAVIISMEGREDLAPDIERLVAYKHPFPSPKMKFLHAAEYDSEDGVVIISIEQLMQSLRLPEENYHITYHVWCERKIGKTVGFPEIPEGFEASIERLFGFDKVQMEKLIGYEISDFRILALNAYFTKSKNLKSLYPNFCKKIQLYLQS